MRFRLPMFLVAALLSATTAHAQQASGSLWTFLYGCWVAVADAESRALPPVSCVLPNTENANAIELVTLKDGQIERHASLFGDGTPMAISENGCEGTEAARFSLDGRRVYVEGYFDCGDGVRRQTSTVMALSPTEEWVEVHAIRTGSRTTVRTTRSTRLDLGDLTEPLRAELAALDAAALAARRGASKLPGPPEIIEASSQLQPLVVETWLAGVAADAPKPIAASRRVLETLLKAAVPSSTIDMVVALGNRDHFQVALAADGASAVSNADLIAQLRRSAPAGAVGPAGAANVAMSPFNNAFCSRLYWDMRMNWLPYGTPYFHPYFGMIATPLSCADAGLFWGGSAWGRNLRFGYWGIGYTDVPVNVVVRPSNDRGGKMVKGGGYQQSPSSSPSGQARPRMIPPASSRPASTSGGASSSSGSSSGSSGRTAKPRSP